MEPAYTDDARRRLDRNIVHPWDDLSATPNPPRTFLRSGEGIHVVDSNGQRLIDGPAGMWCVNVGHGRAEMAEAIAAQIMTLDYVSPWSFGTDPSLRLTERLTAYTPGDLNHVVYTTCGSTAVDSALRFAFFYNHQRGRPDKNQIISRVGAYHGSTFLTATCSGKASEKEGMEMATGLVHHLTMPKPLNRPAGQSEAEFCDALVAELEDKILELGADRVAAFIAEPVMGSGGVIVPPDGYHRRTAEVCRRHDVLYISDEVVTAFGRLGAMFASEDIFGFVPDIITTAKGITSGYIPMGAVFISDRLIDEIGQHHSEDPAPFFNGFTYSGHPVAVAAAETNLDILESEGLIEHARSLGVYFQQRMSELASIDQVVEVRGEGLMVCIECQVDPDRAEEAADTALADSIDRLAQQAGLILRPSYNMCILSPPLTITEAVVDEMVTILRESIEGAARALG